mgnify:CR=1 FL=1
MKLKLESTHRERWLMIVAMEEYASSIKRNAAPGQMESVIVECEKIIKALEESK